jgi:hypothetical protein
LVNFPGSLASSYRNRKEIIMADNKDKSQQGKQDVLDQGGVGFTNEDAAGTSLQGQSAGEANRQSADPGQSAGASNGKAWREDVPDQSGVGFTAEDAGSVQGGSQNQQNQQSGNAGSGAQAGSGQYTGGAGAGESRQSGFVHSSLEANVFPAGSRQGDNSDRSTGGHSAAGTPDEGRLGGAGGSSAAGTTGNDPDR